MASSSSSSPPAYYTYDNNGDGSTYNNSPFNQVKYTLNSRIMVAAIIVLFVVIVFVVSLHVYAKWFWRHTSLLSGHHHRRSRRGRGRLHFVIEDPPFIAASQQQQYRVLGLDKSVIDALPTFAYMPLREGPDADKNDVVSLCECAVCLCEFEENDKCRLLPDCKHSFHIECIDMWFHSHATCPLCRTPVLPQSHRFHQDDLNSSIPVPVLTDLEHSSESNPDPDTEDQHPHRMPSIGTSQHPTPSSRVRHGNTASVRSLSHICIDISGGSIPPEAVPIPRCFSLRLSRFPSHRSASGEDINGCSAGPSSPPNAGQTLKSPSFRVSIKRLLSLDRSRARSRIFPSGQDSSSSAAMVPDNNSGSNSSV